jgi:hypothetical protein
MWELKYREVQVTCNNHIGVNRGRWTSSELVQILMRINECFGYASDNIQPSPNLCFFWSGHKSWENCHACKLSLANSHSPRMTRASVTLTYPQPVRLMINYTGCIKKTEQIWNCSQFRKTAISIQFLIYIVSLGTYDVEIMKKISRTQIL